MGFKEKLKEKRVEANLTQVQLAEKISVTARTIQNYELGTRKPTKYATVEQLAAALNTTAEYLLGQSGMLVLDAQEKGGSKAAKNIIMIGRKVITAPTPPIKPSTNRLTTQGGASISHVSAMKDSGNNNLSSIQP